MENSLQLHFARFFRLNLLLMVVLFYLALGGFAMGTVYSRIHAARTSAEAYLNANRSYFLGLSLSNNADAIRSALGRQNLSNDLIRYELHEPGSHEADGLTLDIAGRDYGHVAYTLAYRTIIFDYRVMGAVLVLLAFAVSSVIFYRRVMGFLRNNLVAPLDDLSREISSKSDLRGLSSLKTPERTIVELKNMHRALIRTASLIQSSQEKLRHVEVLEALSQAAQGVAHDIRSPLAALSVATRSLDGIPEDTRSIITAATDRIRHIANGLLDYAKQAHEERGAARDLQDYLGTLVDEKRMEWRGKSTTLIEFQRSQELFRMEGAKMASLGRAISNLLNNAIEASSGAGKVEMRINGAGDKVEIQIVDQGAGIPAGVLSRLGAFPLTHGKGGESGSGLGVYHARRFLESLEGELTFQSEVGQGTRVTMTIPLRESR